MKGGPSTISNPCGKYAGLKPTITHSPSWAWRIKIVINVGDSYKMLISQAKQVLFIKEYFNMSHW